MKQSNLLNSFPILLLSFAVPAFAGVVVNNPANGTDVSSTFDLSATAAVCSSQPVSSMGYSLDDSADTKTVNSQALDAKVVLGAGAHTVHVKAWGDKGAPCVTDVAVTVNDEASLSPEGAASIGSIENLDSWQAIHDPATSGWSNGATKLVSSPSRSGSARAFYTTYGGSGGEGYRETFSDDQSATNFVYDGWIYLTDSAAKIANLEFDLSQVMTNGQTVVFGMLCDGYSGTWDYSANTAGPRKPSGTWTHSTAPCNVRSWSRNAWHHVQFSYSRTESGVVTYKAVYVDGKKQAINKTAPSAYALGWGPTLMTNFQVDGIGNGSVTLYMDDLTVYRW